MDGFKPFLREINESLDLPQPIKSRIILEIAADLKDAFATYKKLGLSDKEAIMKTKNIFKFDKKTLKELKSVHQTAFRKWFDQLSEQGKTKIERILFVIIMITVFITGIGAALNTSVFYQAGYFIWGILFVLLCASVVFILKLYQIYIKKDHMVKKIRSGVSSLLFLSGLSIFICILGYYWDLYTFREYGHILETKLIYLLYTSDAQFLHIYHELIGWMIKSSSFIMVSMLATLIMALMWFFIMSKISRIEAAEAESLLLE